MRPSASTMRRVLAGLLVLVLATIVWSTAASAHAELERSNPVNGAQLDESPKRVVLDFTEQVSVDLGGLRVLDAEGQQVDDGDVQSDGPRVSVGIAGELPDGSYAVSYRVVSLDSHPIRGGYVFSVGDVEADPSILAGTGSSGDRTWDWVGNVSRWIAYLGTLLAAGGAAFLIIVYPEDDGRRRLEWIVTGGAVVGALGILAALPVQAALATGGGIGSLFDSGVLQGVLGDGVGWATAAGVFGLLLVVVGIRFDDSIAGLGVLLAAGSFAITGHNRASDVAVLASVTDVVHVWAAATWFGGLVLLPFALRGVPTRAAAPRDLGSASGVIDADAEASDTELAEALRIRRNRDIVRRFSALAAIAVVVVAIAGSVLTWIEVRSLDALTSTDYGALLIAKIGVVALAVGIAVYNNRALAPAVRTREDGGPVPTLRRLAVIEAFLLVVVLGITAFLVQVTPARTQTRAGGIVELSVPLGDVGSAQIVIDPAAAGQNVVHVYTLDPDGVPEAIAEELSVSTSLPSADLGPFTSEGRRAGPSHFQIEDDLFPAAGTWELTVDARIDRFTEVSGSAEVPISP